jgi:hypothetical protein
MKSQAKVKGAKALAARVRSTARIRLAAASEPNVLNFDPLEQMTNSIVDMATRGDLDFLDPLGSEQERSPEFDQIFTRQMMVEFGAENGIFLIERYRAGKVSPRMRKQIEAIREYAAGAYRRQSLTNSMVLDTVAELYRKSFHQGGLEQVDLVISKLNEKLRLSGSRFGFGPGTACMEGDSGTTEWIAVIFSDLSRDEFIALEWCHLQYHPVL